MDLKNRFFKNGIGIQIISMVFCFGISQGVNAETDYCSQIFQENEVSFNLMTRAWVFETMQPKLDRIREQYLKEPEKSRSGLENILGHRLFNRFAYNYIRTVEIILRDLIIEKRENIAHNIEGDVYYLISILSSLVEHYQPREFKQSRDLNSDEEVVYGLLDSIFKMLRSKIDDYPLGLSRQERNRYVQADHKTALMILGRIRKLNQASIYYLLVYKPELMDFLMSNIDQNRELALSAIRNLRSQDSEHISFTILKLVERNWKRSGARFSALIRLLYDSVEYNRSVLLSDSGRPSSIDETLSQRVNAPVRDLELNLANIIHRLLLRKDVSQSVMKGFELLQIMLEKPISPSDRALDIVTDTLAKAAVRSLSVSEEKRLNDYLREFSIRTSRSFNVYQIYLEKKKRELNQVSTQINRVLDDDLLNDQDVILF